MNLIHLEVYIIEVNDVSKIKEVKEQLQDISDDFHIFYSYKNLEKAVQVYEEFKHTIDIFEYMGIIVSIILAVGFWYMRRSSDGEMKKHFNELRLSKLQFIKYFIRNMFGGITNSYYNKCDDYHDSKYES